MLAATAGAQTLLSVVQRRPAPDPRYFFGRGKVLELADLAKENMADLVIFNEELSPSQARNLEELLGVRAVDRTALILDIFAQRARSREGKLQVELAQLQYLLPRLIGLGNVLSRLGGGIGTRGPGETKLEIDRRRIRRRINELRREIESLRRQRSLHRKQRQKNKLPVVSLVGYTNAGKSTLLNALTGSNLYTEDKLFATLDPSVRKGKIDGERTVLFSDTVGFIDRLPPQLWSAFQATLEEIKASDLLLHVVDLSHPNYQNQMFSVRQHLGRLDDRYFERELTVFNKIDLLEGDYSRGYLERQFPGACFISAAAGTGLEALADSVFKFFDEQFKTVRLYFNYRDGSMFNQLQRSGRLVSTKYHADFLEAEARLSPADINRFRSYTSPPPL